MFFGFVSPIGADHIPVVKEFRSYFEKRNYRVVEIKVTDIYDVVGKYIKPNIDLERHDRYKRFLSYISYGNQLRSEYTDDILAVASILRIVRQRVRTQKDHPFARTVFLLYQFKRKEEIDLLRSVYGRLFFQVSVYSRRGARVDFLARDFAHSKNESGPYRYRDQAEKIIKDDENEVGQEHGQRVAKIFHDADLIVSLDTPQTVHSQVERMCELVFGANTISPTHLEYGMFLAKAAALRTLDLSRQVGAAIFSREGEIISLGSNEVPKATGGTYWCDEQFDDREHVRGLDRVDEITQVELCGFLGGIDCDS
jgi:deoxycytidylate deaminase